MAIEIEGRAYRLGDLVEIFDGPHATPAKTASGPIFLGISNLVDGRLDLSRTEHVSEEDFIRWTRRVIPQANDLVFSYETRLGEAALIPAGLRCCLGRRMGLLRAKTQAIEPRYLLYAYLSNAFQETLRQHTVPGSTVDRIPLVKMPEFLIRIPPISEQRAIADTLGSFDDKIQLNTQINTSLEMITQMVFKSWFIDFEPVRAKSAARDTHLPKYFVDLLPDSFAESELGEIPTGWRIASLGDLCHRVAIGPFGSDITTNNFVDTGIPVIRGSNLTHGFVDDGFVYVSEQKADELRNANAFPGDIVITHRGTLGQVGLIPRKSKFPRYLISQSQMLLSPDINLASPQFLLEYLRSAAGQHQLLANTSQTGVPAIARPTTSLKAIRLVLPPIDVARSFEALSALLTERYHANLTESKLLASIRNALLPTLVSDGRKHMMR